MSEEEAFEHAIEMIQTRQMGFRKAADFFSVNILLRLTDKFIFNELIFAKILPALRAV